MRKGSIFNQRKREEKETIIIENLKSGSIFSDSAHRINCAEVKLVIWVSQVVLVLKAWRYHGEKLRLGTVKGQEKPLAKVQY